MKRFAAIAVVACIIAPSPVLSAVTPGRSPTDARIRIVRYEPDQVVELEGTLGFATTITFGPGERIENVSIGDSLGWQVTPNRRANLLFVKPIDRSSTTNMAVVTNLRTYNFDLHVRRSWRRGDPAVVFSLHFEYPEPVKLAAAPAEVSTPAAPPPPKDVNHAYSFEGSSKGLPSRVFDDGVSTYFEFPASVDVPAIFAVDADKKEAVVNVSFRDNLLVVDRLARAFVLRRGAEISRIVNDGFHEADSQGLAPHKTLKGTPR